MKLTKEQVEMFKDDAENATFKHGYDMTIIDLCTDWLEMENSINCAGMVLENESEDFEKLKERNELLREDEEYLEQHKDLMERIEKEI